MSWENRIIRFSTITPEILKEVLGDLSKLILNKDGIKEEVLGRGLPQNYYPNIKEWFDKVLNEIKVNNKNREMFLVLVPKDIIAGILILKNTDSEKKICTIRVWENYQRQGIGTALFEKSFEFLGTKTPLLTLPEECKESFKKILKKYNFIETSSKKDIYRLKKTEYFYNEK